MCSVLFGDSMTSLLIEIGCEEIPARFCQGLIDQLSSKSASVLTGYRLGYQSIRVFATYRRLTLLVDQLDLSQQSQCINAKGPSVAVGRKDGVYQPAAIGFAKKFGISPESLIEEDVSGEPYFFARLNQSGQDTKSLVPKIVQDVFGSLNLPISMSWGNGEHQFIRPVQWVCALFGSDMISFSFKGIQSGQLSYGHRLLSSTDNSNGIAILINSPETYCDQLAEAYVLVDHSQRQCLIQSALGDISFSASLLEETSFLTEWPTVLTGHFNSSYLQLPDDVIIQFMQKHQKYFPSRTNDQLDSHFLFVADNVTDSNQSQIISGNESVLRARLEDASFFYAQDQKSTLSDHAIRLKSVLFQKNLGSIYAKVERMTLIAAWIVSHCQLTLDLDAVQTIVTLSKADLVTDMVVEMPSLQGVMGKRYAKLNGYSSLISDGVFEHYLPRNAEDRVPSSIEAAVVGLADRMDTLVCCFFNDLLPTGSQDPWALRRLMNGVCKLVDSFKLRIDMSNLIDYCWDVLAVDRRNDSSLRAFVIHRQKQYLSEFLEMKIRPDIIESVSHRLGHDLVEIIDYVLFLNEFQSKNSNQFRLISETAVRVCRILKGQDISPTIDPSVFEKAVEKQAYDAINQFAHFDDLLPMATILSQYFDEILVMSDDHHQRQNRLNLLSLAHSKFSTIANFEKIIT